MMSQSLIQQVRSNPTDERSAHQLFLDYETSKDHEQSYDLTYLQLKWLYSQDQWRYLSEIAKLYLNVGKSRIAFMCLITSLHANPGQSAVFELAESLKEPCSFRMTDRLREDKLTVSVIMRTYNRVAEIRDSIQSVLNQSYQDFELVIVNDGGTDDVKEVVDSFHSGKIKYHKHARNQGIGGALNEGILRAEGKYIAYLDDDDVYYPDHLGALLDVFDKRPNCDVVYSNAWWCFGKIKGDTFVAESKKLLDRRPSRFDRDLLFSNNYISTLNLLHRKSCFRGSGLFNEDLEKCEDWEMWLRFARKYNFFQLNDITGEYRFRGNNTSTADLLSMSFFSTVIRCFSETCNGDIVFLKHYLRNGQTERAEDIFDRVLSGYDRCPQAAKKELFYASKEFPYWKSKGLYGNLALDFLKRKTKRFPPFFRKAV
jgi:glycosyltransferase involved in cell wall biosynthesis